MSELFRRKCQLTIGPRVWTDLRVAFKVVRSIAKTPNPAEIAIYNLGPESRGLAEVKGQRVVLAAGYEGSAEVIFSGQITRAEHRKQGPDLSTTIRCRDGHDAWNAYTRRAYRRGAANLTLVLAIAKDMGLVVPPAVLAQISGTQFGPVAFNGRSHGSLDVLLRSLGFEWSIQSGLLQVMPIGASTSQGTVLLSEKTGLVGSPSIMENGRVMVESLLQPGIRPGRIVLLRSVSRNGEYKAERVTHTGDTHGQQWTTQMELKAA